MSVDWFTLGAQIANFLVLVFLLQRFLYKPLLKAMDARQQRIRDAMAAAEGRKDEVEAAARAYDERAQTLEEEREERMRSAEQAAERWEKERLEEARKELQKTRSRWRESLEKELQRSSEELQHSFTGRLVQAVRKALTDLADASLERQMVRRFVLQIESLDDSAAAVLRSANDESGELKVRSGYTLDSELQAAIQEGISSRLGESTSVEFVQASGVTGIQLKADGYEISWTLDGYLEDFERAVQKALEELQQSRSVEEHAA